MLPAIRHVTGKSGGGAGQDDAEDPNGAEGQDDASEEDQQSHASEREVGVSPPDQDNSHLQTTSSRHNTGVHFFDVETPLSAGSRPVKSFGEAEEYETGNCSDKDSRSNTNAYRGRTPTGWIEWSKRPATQGGPNGYFPSAVPKYTQAKGTVKRERAVFKKPGVKVFHLQDTTYELNVETGVPTLALYTLSRMSHGAGHIRQKKLVSVPFNRKKRPSTTGDEPEENVIPEHLQKRWRLLQSPDERRAFGKMYSTRYKSKEVLAWTMEDVFSFVADSFVNDAQVDVGGLALPKKLIKEDGVRADACLDVLVLRKVKIERMDGKKMMAKMKKGLLGMSFKLDAYDPTLAVSLSTAAKDYVRLNARKKVAEHEGITAKQTLEAVQNENADEVLMQELIVSEVELRHEKARLKELRERMAPLQSKFKQGADEFQLLEQHCERLKTPDVRAFVRPKSRREVFSLKKAVDDDLTRHQDKWMTMAKEEHMLAREVRDEEMKTLALRQQVETGQILREARRKQMWDEQLQKATDLEYERDGVISKVDVLLKACDEMIAHASSTVQTQLHRSQRDELLRGIGDKIFTARKMCVEACRYQYRRRRIEALDVALEFAIEKLRDGDVHLTKLQANLVSAAAVEDSAPQATTSLRHLLEDSREHLRRAKRDYRRTGAMSMVAPNINDCQRSMEALELRIAEVIGAKRKEELDAAAAAAAEAAEAEVLPETLSSESSEEEEDFTDFEKTLDRLIEEKTRQTLEQVPDSLCSMQQWLFEVKAKSKGQQAASSSAGDSKVAASQSSTRPTSPWASNYSLPSVTGPLSPTHTNTRSKTALSGAVQLRRGTSPPKKDGKRDT